MATADTIAEIVASWVDTRKLQGIALTGYTWDGSKPLWKGIDRDAEAAAAYYAEILESNPDQAREEAAEILAEGGWDMSKINFRLS